VIETPSAPEAAGLSATIVATLKRRIIGWEYPPDHRLTEEGLSQEFGVSRSPVREALRVLATTGFIRKLANRGYAVHQVSLREVEELYDLRLALELHVAESLAERGGSEETLHVLRETWLDIRHAPARRPEEMARLDTVFHETLAEAAGNRALLQQLRAIDERLLVFRIIDFESEKRTESTCLQHVAIIDRILARDTVGARLAVKDNIEDSSDIVRSSLKAALAKAYAIE
jgi:DNA-binding GntR family transcriptional regulator